MHGACTDMRPEFLLQDLQEVALREIHLEDGVKLVVPGVRFGADGHRQRDEVLGCHVWNVGHHALEVADLFKNANVATEDIDIQLQAPPRSRRSSSRVPGSNLGEGHFKAEYREHRQQLSGAKLRHLSPLKAHRDSLVIPERKATSLWFSPRAFRRAETASPSSASVCMV